jgi:tetratricopeptide (TPR) repeat protein
MRAHAWCQDMRFGQKSLEACLAEARAKADRGRYADVITDIEPLLSSGSGQENNSEYGQLYQVLGIAYCETRDYDRAARSLEIALRIGEEIKDAWLVGASLYELAVMHHKSGDSDKALDYCQKAIVAPGLGKKALLMARQTMAAIYRKRGELDKAEQVIRDVIKEAGSRLDLGTVGRAFNELAAIAEDRDDLPAALKFCGESLGVKQLAGDIPGVELSIANVLVLLERHPDRRSDPEVSALLDKMGLNYQ